MAPSADAPSDVPSVPTDPLVDTFDAATVTVEDVAQSLVRNGGCVVRGLLTADEARAIERDVRPFLGQDDGWQPAFWPRETRRVCGLAGKSKTFVARIASHPLYEAWSADSPFVAWGQRDVRDVPPAIRTQRTSTSDISSAAAISAASCSIDTMLAVRST